MEAIYYAERRQYFGAKIPIFPVGGVEMKSAQRHPYFILDKIFREIFYCIFLEVEIVRNIIPVESFDFWLNL